MNIIGERFKNAWSAFMGRDPTSRKHDDWFSSFYRPDRRYSRSENERSMNRVVYNQIAVDCAAINIKHVRLNDSGKYKEEIDGPLNQALTSSANIDQTGRAMMIQAVESLLEEGCIAFVPVTSYGNPELSDNFKVAEIRVGKIVEWQPRKVRVEIYNEYTGRTEQLMCSKSYTAIVENPFFTIMNSRNSTAQRLARTLSKLDQLNEAHDPSKLDMIVQLPFPIRSEAKMKLAEARRREIEEQLMGSAHGIAYVDGAEKIIQLNRSLENNLWTQAKELNEQLFNQLGLCKAVFEGTADEQTMLNYYNRSIEPILSAITEEMERKWLSKTARSQKQAIRFYRDPFKLVPVLQLAEISDKLTRNEIMSSNEIRSIIGLKPDPNPKSDMLINSNLNQSKEDLAAIGLGANNTTPDENDSNSEKTTNDLELPEQVWRMTV